MAIQKINLGTEPHGVGGDSYRTANEKINSNFEEVGKDIKNVLEVVQTGDFTKTAYDIAVENGFVGSQEEWLLSLRGDAGPKGDTGAQGPIGVSGKDGIDGLTAYKVAVNSGFIGDESAWLSSLVGKDGVGISNIVHNEDDTLTFTLTDKTSYTTKSLKSSGIVTVDNVAELKALPENAKREDLRYLVKGYHAGSNVGGGLFEYAPTSPFLDDGGRRIGDFVRIETTYDTPFTFANYGYDFENHSISGQVIAQKIFNTALTVPESEHIVIEISDGVIFTDSVATLNRANLTMRGNGTAYVSSAADGTNRFIQILLSGERNKNLVLENLKFTGLFNGTLLDMYKNRSSEYGRRFYVSGADGVRVRGVTAKRIAIPMDIRNSNNVHVNNLSLTQGNCGLSVINSTSVNISNVTGIDCTGSVVDFSDVRGGVVSTITGFTSEEGRGYAEEFFDMGSCKDLAISNLQSIGPTGNMIRIKFEDINLPFSNIRFSNIVGRGSAVGVIIQPSTNNTGTLTEHIHIDGITIDSTSACIAMTGTTRVYNVSIANFNLISRGGAVIELPGISDINISNGSAFCAAPNNTSAAILLGKRAASGGIAGDRIRLSNVSVGSSNLGREAVNITEANGVFMSDVTVTQSERDGITFVNCRDVNLSNMEVNKIGRSGITASFSATTFADGEDVGFRIKSSNFTDFGYTTANRAAIALTVNGISVSGVDITGNHARVTPLAPANARFHTLFTPTNGGSFGLGSIFTRNTTKGIQKMTGGNVGSVLVKDNDAIDIAPVEPPVVPEPEV